MHLFLWKIGMKSQWPTQSDTSKREHSGTSQWSVSELFRTTDSYVSIMWKESKNHMETLGLIWLPFWTQFMSRPLDDGTCLNQSSISEHQSALPISDPRAPLQEVVGSGSSIPVTSLSSTEDASLGGQEKFHFLKAN